jgi:hypothetical protein
METMNLIISQGNEGFHVECLLFVLRTAQVRRHQEKGLRRHQG